MNEISSAIKKAAQECVRKIKKNILDFKWCWSEIGKPFVRVLLALTVINFQEDFQKYLLTGLTPVGVV